MSRKNTVSIKEIISLVNMNIDNNIRLQEDGKMPIAIGVEGQAGLGKTSIIRQIAKERGMTFVKLNLSQAEEAGDIAGYPIKEYECQLAKVVKDENGNNKMQILPGTTWLNEKQLDAGIGGMKVRQTGKTRMNYAKPAWVPEYNENGTILLLDDYNRASQQILQSCMELILEQKFGTWSLPKKTTIVLEK